MQLSNTATNRVPSRYHRRLGVLEAILADVNLGQSCILLGVRRRIPRVHLIATHLQLTYAILLLVTKGVVSRHLIILTSRTHN